MKSIGILGGMGPLAGIDLFNKITAITDIKCEQDHAHVVLESNPHIPDRTAFILDRSKTDPTSEMISCAKRLENAGVSCIVMACNTAHFFYDAINEQLNTPFLHIIKECAKACKGEEKLGLLATTGSYKAGLYKDIFAKQNCEIIEPSDMLKELITDMIYSYKAGKIIPQDELLKVSAYFEEKGVKRLILGCTELPLIFAPHPSFKSYIDPNLILAKAALNFIGLKVKDK